jgi:hypothetical protein
MLTFASDVADVGLRPGRTSIELGMLIVGGYKITEVESCKSKSSGHDGEEDLQSCQSMGHPTAEALRTYSSGSLLAPLFKTLPSAPLAAALPA